MSKSNFDEIIRRSLELRKKYHKLEVQHHESEWSVEEDALAYLTDAHWLAQILCRRNHVGQKPILRTN